jgi:hypothetical protein
MVNNNQVINNQSNAQLMQMQNNGQNALQSL